MRPVPYKFYFKIFMIFISGTDRHTSSNHDTSSRHVEKETFSFCEPNCNSRDIGLFYTRQNNASGGFRKSQFRLIRLRRFRGEALFNLASTKEALIQFSFFCGGRGLNTSQDTLGPH